MTDFKALKERIIKAGTITLDDVSKLREIIYHDNVVEQDEAEFLFELRKEIPIALGAWNKFFINAICDFLLDDKRSPDAIDDEEAAWLIAMIGDDGIIDELEYRLLKKLKCKANNFPQHLEDILHNSKIEYNITWRILRLLCGVSPTMTSLRYGVAKNGMHRKSPIDEDSSDSDNNNK